MVGKQFSIRALFLLTILLSAVQCSDSPSSVDDSNNKEPVQDENEVCESLEIQSDSAEPGDIIIVEGFSDELGEDAIAWMKDPENPGSKAPIIFFQDTANESADFILPIHPQEWMNGGKVNIEFVEENQEFTCSGFTFTVEPLTPSPGETERFISAYQDGLKQLIEHMGYNPDILIGKPTKEVDLAVAPMHMALRALDSDKFENNLMAIMDGSAPIYGNEPLPKNAKNVIDALFAKTKMTENVKKHFSSLLQELENLSKSKNFQKPKSFENSAPEGTNSPGFVSNMMKVQSYYENQLTGDQGTVLELAQLSTDMLTITFGLASFATAGATAPFAVAAGASSLALSVYSLMAQACAYILPGQLTSFITETEPIIFNEDSEITGEWETLMTVESRDFEITGSDIAGYALEFWDPMSAGAVKETIGALHTEFLKLFRDLGMTFWGVTDETGIEWEKNYWQIVVVPERDNERDYFEWELVPLESYNGGPAFEICSDCNDANLGYRPLQEGKAELRIKAYAEPFNFPTTPIETQEVVVNPINIEITPQNPRILLKDVEAGKTVDLSATVEYAENKLLRWTSEKGVIEPKDKLAHNISYKPPAKTGTYEVTAEAITEDGPREGRVPPRTENTYVFVEEEEEGCAHFDEDNAKTVRVEASGSYNNTSEGADFSISYAFMDADEESESACTDYGAALEDDISIPWSYEKRMSPPFSASINIVGLENHTNNMKLTIYVDDEAVAEYTVDGFLEDDEIEPEDSLVHAE